MGEHQHGAHAGSEPGYFLEMLDLDGVVLADTFSSVTEWIAGHLGDHRASRILDLVPAPAPEPSPYCAVSLTRG